MFYNNTSTYYTTVGIYKVWNQSRETKHLFLWWMKHISLLSFTMSEITWTFARSSEFCLSCQLISFEKFAPTQNTVSLCNLLFVWLLFILSTLSLLNKYMIKILKILKVKTFLFSLINNKICLLTIKCSFITVIGDFAQL